MSRLACLIFALAVFTPLASAQEVSVAGKRQPIGPLPMNRLVGKIEPGMKGDPGRLQQYVDFFRRELGNDPRLFAFDVNPVTKSDGRVELRGYIEFPESRKTLVNFLTALGFEVDDRLETLPAESLGERRFGFVKVSHTLSYDRPRGRRTPVTDCLLGEPLFLLREASGHVLVHSGDGYLGYVRDADIHRVNESEFAQYLDGQRLRMILTYDAGDGLLIPAGARLTALITAGNALCQMPGGRPSVTVPEGSYEIRNEPTQDIDKIIKNARRLLGTRYKWGGKTSEGVDCSGLVQVGFASVGWHLPRDSNQQFYLGRLTATRWHTAGMRRGDTLYFLGSDGRIRHTALYLGDDHYLQAVEPVVEIASFNPEHKNYDANRHAAFAFAKRLVE